MARRWNCMAVLAAAMVAGCATAALQTSGKARLLTADELDDISAGSAVAVSAADASGLGGAPVAVTNTSSLVSSGNPIGNPIGPPSFANMATLNYAFSQALASASNAAVTQAAGSIQVGVVGSGGGATIAARSIAAAAGGSPGDAEINMQFYAISVGSVDLAFGSATATACCAPTRGAQTIVDTTGGGHWREAVAHPLGYVPGQIQSRIDIAVISSALPILDPGQASVLGAPSVAQSGSQ
jgi:hypothetical protein